MSIQETAIMTHSGISLRQETLKGVWCLIDELAPLPIVLSAIRNNDTLKWPSLEAQIAITEWLHSKVEYPLPKKYILALMKLLERDISETNSVDDEQFADEFVEYFLSVRASPGDEEDTGYQQFTVLGKAEKLPILIKRSHNQVGTKVWSAGLLLAEILQYECKDNLLLADMSFLELGAGVGISSLLWFYSLPSSVRMKKLLITDYAWSVLDLVDKNIEIAKRIFADATTGGHIQSSLLDWAMLSDEDVNQLSDINCLLAADCTYSPDLNTVLVRLFDIYFTAYLQKHPSVRNSLAMIDQKPANDFLLLFLLKHNIPCIFIACTLRNEETFTHFITSLNGASPTFTYNKVTDDVHNRLNGKELYFIPDRLKVEVFCIYPVHK